MNNQNKSPLYIVDLIKSVSNSIKYLFKKWLIIFFVAILGGLIGVAYAWLKTPEYIAELTFSTETSSDGQIGIGSLAAQFGFDIGGGGTGGAFEGDNLMELMKSRNIVEKTLLTNAPNMPQKLMIDLYLNNHKLNKSWASNEKMKNIFFIKNPASKPERLRDSVMNKVYDAIVKTQLSVDKKDKKLNYIVVKMKDSDEAFSKNFTDMLVETSIQFFTEYKTKKAKQNYDLLYFQTDSIKRLLYGNIESYAQTNDLNVNPLKQQARTSGQKIQVNAQTNTAIYTELMKQLGLAKVNLERETPLVQIIDKPILPLVKKKPGRLFTGITFAFLAGCFICFYFLFIRWIKHEFKTITK